MPGFSQLPPLSLYIHFPWCLQKCPYCDFNSHEVKRKIPESEYINALIQDLENDLPKVWGRRVSSIFIGGGTPSLLQAESIDFLLSSIRARIPLSPNAEITMEANPGSMENKRFSEFQEAGINRLSIGIQSFNDKHLKALGRVHNAEEAQGAIENALSAKFNSVNLDLMFALPGQTLEEASCDIETAISFGTEHLSYYQLTLEPNTAFYSNPPSLPEHELSWDIFNNGINVLAAAGLERYEISAYAKGDKKCRHNENYWQFGDYLGIGAGAHAKITDANEQSIARYRKLKNPKDYLSSAATNDFISGQHILNQPEIVFDFLLNGLRLTDGFDVALFELHTGLAEQVLKDTLGDAVNKGLVKYDFFGKSYRTTEKGRDFLDDVLQNCLPD